MIINPAQIYHVYWMFMPWTYNTGMPIRLDSLINSGVPRDARTVFLINTIFTGNEIRVERSFFSNEYKCLGDIAFLFRNSIGNYSITALVDSDCDSVLCASRRKNTMLCLFEGVRQDGTGVHPHGRAEADAGVSGGAPTTGGAEWDDEGGWVFGGWSTD